MAFRESPIDSWRRSTFLSVPPRIGLDLSYLDPGATGGMEIYARSLVPEMHRERPDARFLAFVGTELAAELRRSPWTPNLSVVELPYSSGWRFRRVLGEQTAQAAAVARHRPDLLHSLGNTSPLTPTGVPHVVSVHDTIWARYPETVSPLLRYGIGPLVRGSVRRAARVITGSQAARSDLVAYLGAEPDRIDVVPHGVRPPRVEPTPAPRLRDALGLGSGPIVLCPAPNRPHKNLERLAAAVEPLDATLVVPGYAAVGVGGTLPGAITPGWVSEEDLEGLYAASTCLAFASLAEGFGLPILEAMARGLPVACSNLAPMTEVAGAAAVLFDPLDVASIRASVQQLLLTDPGRRAELSDRGRRQAASFTWQRSAAGTLAVYDRVLGSR